jgi:hypothetical protein
LNDRLGEIPRTQSSKSGFRFIILALVDEPPGRLGDEPKKNPAYCWDDETYREGNIIGLSSVEVSGTIIDDTESQKLFEKTYLATMPPIEMKTE